MLHIQPHSVGLHHLGGVDKPLERVWIMGHLSKVIHNFLIARLALLMRLHNRGHKVKVILFRKPADGLYGRYRLKAILRAEAEFVAVIIGKGPQTVPYSPVV